jgi:GNAT superfamily N-acetyltransferase
MEIRRARTCDAELISDLIVSLSHPFFINPSREGAEQFLASISAAAERGYISDPRYCFYIAEIEQDIAGFIAMRDYSHVFHLFVENRYQGRGIAKALWTVARNESKSQHGVRAYTVNASLNAVPIYERFGFVASSTEVQSHGVKFLPMRLEEGEESFNTSIDTDE